MPSGETKRIIKVGNECPKSRTCHADVNFLRYNTNTIMNNTEILLKAGK